MIFGKKMEDIEQGSFIKTMIDNHAQAIYPCMCFDFETRNKRKMTLIEQREMMKYCIVKSGEMFQSIIKATELRPEFKKLLNENLKKKEQVALLKGQKITKMELLKLFYEAEEQGYLFTNFIREKKQNSVADDDLPSFIYLDEDGKLQHFGETSLSDGQMKQLIDQREVLIARIIEKDNHWHCFLQTFKGLKDLEGGDQGKVPHIHYISDSFGISKDKIAEQIKNGEYPSTKVHIPLIDS